MSGPSARKRQPATFRQRRLTLYSSDPSAGELPRRDVGSPNGCPKPPSEVRSLSLRAHAFRGRGLRSEEKWRRYKKGWEEASCRPVLPTPGVPSRSVGRRVVDEQNHGRRPWRSQKTCLVGNISKTYTNNVFRSVFHVLFLLFFLFLSKQMGFFLLAKVRPVPVKEPAAEVAFRVPS